MNLTTDSKLCGFSVKRIRRSDELNGNFIEMTHDKTGAELCYMDNNEENKLFCIGFKTIPEDSTGVFHILEHSVLCGSEKYPVKEPFVDLLKSSMNTFLNAMTYPDKTVYPVSSRNEQDFLNLTSVYLDAVFAPKLTVNPNIFYQEGIHTEISPDGAGSYNGVVFNEMKGAMSEVNGKLEQTADELIFPDTCYRFNSGGDPAVIPDLTYKKYIAAYKKYYHPSNAKIFLDGAVPLEKTLSLIDSYLSRFEKQNITFDTGIQNLKSNEGISYYEASPQEGTDKKAILFMGKIVGTWQDKTKITAAKVLCDVLTDSNESPFTKAVLESGLAENIEADISDCIAQPYLIITVRNLNDSDSAKVRNIIEKTARDLVKNGLDKTAITASVNRLSFNLKQVSEPRGLYRALISYNSWLYGGDPMMYLLSDSTIEELRKMAEKGKFEELLEDLFCNEEGLCVLHMLPSLTLGEEERKAEETRITNELALKSKEEINAVKDLNKNLIEWQQSADLPTDTAKIPALPLSCVKATPEIINTSIQNEGGVTILRHKIPTNGIVYLSLYFPLTAFNTDELAALALFPALIGELPTEKRTVFELQQEIKTYIGSLSFNCEAVCKDGDIKKCTPMFTVRAGILKENLKKAEDILLDILLNSIINNPQKIKELVMQNDTEARQDAIGAGHALAVNAVRAQYSSKGAANDALGGYTYIKKLHNFAKNFDENIDEFIALAEKLQKEALTKSKLTLSITCDIDAAFSDLISGLPAGKEKQDSAEYKTALPFKLGIRVPSQISYAVRGYNLNKDNIKMNGSMKVLSNIISLDYLWNEIRVQGGAYGAGLRDYRDGSIAFYSYRDPSPARSLGKYADTAEYVSELNINKKDLEKYIISAVALTEALKTPFEQGITADELYFAGVTDSDRIELRKQMLETTEESLKEWVQTLRIAAEDGAICVVGNGEALATCKGLTVEDI